MAGTLVRDEPRAIDRIRSSAGTLGAGLALFWAVWLADLVTPGSLVAWGIVPRSLDGLWGVLLAPFLHVNIAHLLVNSISFVLLGAITMIRRRADFWVVSAVGAAVSGLGVWALAGAGTVTVGASGVIFAYLGFLMTRGLFERSLPAIALSAGVAWLFGSMLWGVLPLAVGVSWQAHLFGFLAGVLCAAALGRAIRERKR